MAHLSRFALFTLVSLSAYSSLIAFSVSAEQINTLVVEPKQIQNTLTLDGQLEAVKAATVSAQTNGRVMKLYYDVNDYVEAGAPLLELTSVEQGAQLMAARAELTSATAINQEAQLQLKRFNALFPKGAISQGQMDEVTAKAKSSKQAVSAAKARVTQAEQSVKYTQINAPFSGIVTKRHVQIGETVNTGQPLYSGYAQKQIRAITQVPQRFIKALRQYPHMTVQLANGHQYHSDSLTIFNFADPASHSYQVRINLPSFAAELTPGDWVKVQFVTGERDAITIPAQALITMNELSGVYIKLGDSFVLSQVRLGKSNKQEVEILSGLSQGDVIALDAYQVLMQQNQSH